MATSPHPAENTAQDHFKKFHFGSNEFRNYFRKDFVEKDCGKEYLGIKNGYFYIGVCLLPIMAIIIVLAACVTKYSFYYLLLLPVYFLIFNLSEYLLHRFPMHRKLSPHNLIYTHVTIHHNFYNDDFFYFEKNRDFMAVLLPWYAALIISAIILLIAFPIYLSSDLDNALFFAMCAYSYYLMYELLHFSYHAKKGSFLKELPGIERLARAHIKHHKSHIMNKYNFNITFPVCDVLLGTRYKEQ